MNPKPLAMVEPRVTATKCPGGLVLVTYSALFPTSRDTGLNPGLHHVALHHQCVTTDNGRSRRDALSVNGTYFEDHHGDDYFASELWTDLTCMTFDEFEALAERVTDTITALDLAEIDRDCQ